MEEILEAKPGFKLQSESIIELTKALCKVQGRLKMLPANKTAKIETKVGRNFSYSYADLASVWEAIRRPLTENGFAVIQSCLPENRKTTVITTLAHESGEWVRSILSIPTTDDPQKIGSAMTYARRYALCGIVGVTVEGEDDDAISAIDRKKKESSTSSKQKEKQATDAQIRKIRWQINEFSKWAKVDKKEIENKVKKATKIEHLKREFLTLKKADKLIKWLDEEILKAREVK